MAKKIKKDQPVNKTPELSKSKSALEDYLKKNKLDPQKDWTKDKKHGKSVTELVNKLNKERDKVAAKYPEGDLKNETKLVKMKEKAKKGKEEKKEKKEKTSKSPVQKYDYPLVDGKEMTSAEKKKYRMEQRKLAAGKGPKEPKEKESKKKKEKVEDKPLDKSEKKDKKKKDKKKKAKEED